MEQRSEEKQINIYRYICMVICVLISLLFSFLRKLSADLILRNVIIIIALLIFVIFVYNAEKVNGYNERKIVSSDKRFSIILIIGFAISGALSFLPFWVCSYVFIFVTFSLCLGRYLGLLYSILLLTNSFLLNQNENFLDYLVFLIPGLLACFLFSYVNDEFKVIYPLTITLIIQFVMVSLKEFVFGSDRFTFDLVYKPIANLFINFVLLIIALKLLSVIMNRSRCRMQDIIDSEFELMIRLKEELGEDFNLVVYTALLCSKISLKLKLDEIVVKALGYYHKVNVLANENNWEEIAKLLYEKNIPDNIIYLLKEYFESGECGVKSKENVVLILTESMISSVRYLFVKNKDASVDYEKLANAVVDKKFASGMFDESQISYEDVSAIRKTLAEEKMFYDYLR